LSVFGAGDYDRKKKVPVICLAGCRLRPEKKKVPVVCLAQYQKMKIMSYVFSRVSSLRPEKKKFQSSVWRKKKDTVVCLLCFVFCAVSKTNRCYQVSPISISKNENYDDKFDNEKELRTYI
jgi:hypothetical protein